VSSHGIVRRLTVFTCNLTHPVLPKVRIPAVVALVQTRPGTVPSKREQAGAQAVLVVVAISLSMPAGLNR
jgi:hypothetical protein